MAGRIRSIKPELLENERTAMLSHESWRLFVSLLLLADDYGNLAAQPARIGGSVFWGCQPEASIESLLCELEQRRLIFRYTVKGSAYLSIVGWREHQKVDKPGKPHCPGPDSRDSREGVASDSRDSRETLDPDLDLDLDLDQRPVPVPPARAKAARSAVQAMFAGLGVPMPDPQSLLEAVNRIESYANATGCEVDADLAGKIAAAFKRLLANWSMRSAPTPQLLVKHWDAIQAEIAGTVVAPKTPTAKAPPREEQRRPRPKDYVWDDEPAAAGGKQ